MKIDERLDKMKSELTVVLNKCGSISKEEAIRLLEEVGLNDASAEKLLEAFGEKERAKKTAENVLNTAWNSKSDIDFSTDIRKSSDTEVRKTRYFDGVYSRCAFLMVIKTIDPNEINEEILDKLYEQGIEENEISNPALKTTFHYYSESKAKDKQIETEKRKAENYKEILNQQLQLVENKYVTLKNNFTTLQNNYRKLQTKFQERITSDEKNYQAAISQIETLKSKLKQMQERGFFKIIGDKLTGLFGNKTEKLPEPTSELPKTLFQNKCEKIGMQQLDETEMLLIDSKADIEQTAAVDRTDDELQQ